jgi:hypothetical protein
MLEADNYEAFGTYMTCGTTAYVKMYDGDISLNQQTQVRRIVAEEYGSDMYQGYWFVHKEIEGNETVYTTSHVYIYMEPD